MKIGNRFISIEITNESTPYEGAITPEVIEKCINIAFEAHEGQRDKDGNAVILHPLFVGSMGQTEAEKCVGFLHDVIEDTRWTLDDLRDEEIPEEIVSAVGICTHKKNQDYYDYVQSIIDSGNMTAIHVKQNDLRHNLARGIAFKHPELVAKHEKALKMVEDFLKDKYNY